MEPNYKHQKNQRDLARKKKQEEKRQRRLARRNIQPEENTVKTQEVI